VYWSRWSAGYSIMVPEDARAFVVRAIDEGKTSKRWSDATIRRVAAYLMGCCADFGLMEVGNRASRRLLPYRMLPATAAYLAYDLHFHGMADSSIVDHEDWELFGLSHQEVLAELKELSLKSMLILQSAGDLVRISWKFHSMEALCDVLA
jgi:hypothetical protein